MKGGSTIMATSSLTNCAQVMATKKIIFMERWVREQVARGSRGSLVRAERTRLRSQGCVGYRTEGKALGRQ